ncbi:6-aminohexanoate hydrolase [Acuticoccus sediminis]|uniref:6-aminohexanoate hydrolase n=1 Tax=Acuticoccus sediminis TaxID=2184697 RepID=A0A8B2NIE1_9HYPH|nr:serine hydrolase [Acuticoccus sediminis]RAH99304.1 6-aminohexanoate hydrolase [Acuticoccus sediminis]
MDRPVPDRRMVLAALAGAVAGGLAVPRAVRAAGQADGAFEEVAARAGALDQLHAMVVVHDGETRFARAFRGPNLERAVNVKSVSKSIVALLAGVAIDRGFISGTDATLGELIDDLIPADADPRVKDITVADLLTMQAGLERTSGPNYGAWVGSANWLRFALTRPFVAEPGEAFQYSTGSYHILGVVLARTTERTLLSLAREWLGVPLGIDLPAWTRDPQGYYLGGNNMAMTPRAMALIGETVRLGGTFGDAAVIPPEWIEVSLRPRARSPFSGDEYGYGWFLTELAGERAVYARGYGGQMIYVLPDAVLTVAITSDPTRPARTEGHVGDLHRLVAEAVLPAVTAG